MPYRVSVLPHTATILFETDFPIEGGYQFVCFI